MIQPVEYFLFVVVHVSQAVLQVLHLILEILKCQLNLRPLGIGDLIQQTHGGRGLSLGVVVAMCQDAGENAFVDIQTSMYQLYDIVSLWSKERLFRPAFSLFTDLIATTRNRLQINSVANSDQDLS